MPHPQSDSDTKPLFHRPPCPACGLEMWLVRLETIGPGLDQRTFECQVCQHSEAIIIEKVGACEWRHGG
jgi:hypothetical protein